MTSFPVKRLLGAAIPHRAHDLPEPPRRLYLVGELPRAPAVAVVGTRHPTAEALRHTEELVGQLAKSGIAIWSGGADGIDAAAHRAALRVGATTVVVAPAGWLAPFPPKHVELFREIIERGGAYLSIVPPEREARRHLFFARNALMMALVGAVVIVQAGLRSGARNAAKFARRLGRPIFAAPSCPWVPQGLGCNIEISLGARVLLSTKEVVEVVCNSGFGVANPMSQSDGQTHADPPNIDTTKVQLATSIDHGHAPPRVSARSPLLPDGALGGELEVVIEAIRSGAWNTDAICQRTGLTLPVVQSDVLRLILLGLVNTDPAGAIKLINGGK